MSENQLTKTGATGGLRGMLEGDQFKLQVAKALPKHLTPDRFIRVACTALMKTPLLAECDKPSFFNALLSLSQLGIEPDGRRAHLIPFRNNKRGVVECQLIIDYKGLVELAMRSGTISNLHADVVCENDEFAFDRGQVVKHVIDFKNPRGNVYAVYAIAKFKDGSEKAEAMSVAEVESIRSRSRAGQSGPWVTDWNEMAKKTAFRRLSKWLPLSPEYRDSLDKDDDAIDIGSTAPKFSSDALNELMAETKPVKDNPAKDDDVPYTFPTDGPTKSEQVQESKPSVARGDATKTPGVLGTVEAAPVKENSRGAMARIVTGQGINFDTFQRWAIEIGELDKEYDSFNDLPVLFCDKWAGRERALIRALGVVKEGAK